MVDKANRRSGKDSSKDPGNEPDNKPVKRTRAGADQRAARMRRRIITVAVALLFVGAVAAVLPFTQAVPVKGVEVQGANHLSEEEVRAASGIVEGTPMARVDLNDAAAAVAGLDWVRSASVGRHWPSTVVVRVEENVAVAYTENGDGTHLIDAEGREFTVDAPPPGAIKLGGPALAEDGVQADVVAVATSISERARGQVMSIEARGRYDFVLRLADDRSVVWGAAEDNDNKARALETVLQREGREFNVSNPELVTVR